MELKIHASMEVHFMRVWNSVSCEYVLSVPCEFHLSHFYASMASFVRVWFNQKVMRVCETCEYELFHASISEPVSCEYGPDSCEFQGVSKACEFLKLASMKVTFMRV